MGVEIESPNGMTRRKNILTRRKEFIRSKFQAHFGKWNTSNVTNMSIMFASSQFNQNIGSWNVVNVLDMTQMFLGPQSISQTNYDALLQGWSSQNVKPNVSFSAGTAKYSSSSKAARDILTGKGWTITDGGPASP
jgi:hypothetical protein